ncbi:MAG: YeeE/YedE family protein [Gammaproteobacteria bacterium]|nr:YeeE/YedE family protein [Gammaproteobacteria bacterium]MCW8909729.1 YeeE/YedE family protein [Gammaproteobacteria bacterium]MCW9004938.1 YeeE/YedE family protein [Gammaproteobacteria bacterium]MCW9056334.1 YeeE/YedE family protein [Gammaproteobacteria bacterium]
MSKEPGVYVDLTVDEGPSGWFTQKENRYAAAIMALVALGSVWALLQDTRWVYLLVYVWFGLAYGMFLQYGRFCMASAVRDLFAVGVPRMAVGIMIAVCLYSLVAATVQVSGFNAFHPHPLGWHIIIGGLIFGFGIIFTGGCATGSLYKAGEGNLGSVLVIISISFSQAIFVVLGGWFDKFAPASWTTSALDKGMPEELSVTQGWFDLFTAGYVWDLKGSTLAAMLGVSNPIVASYLINSLLVTILPAIVIVVLLYAFYYRKGHVRREKIEQPVLKDHIRGIWSMVTSSKNTAIAGIGLGAFAGLHVWVTGILRDHYGIFNFGEMLADMGHKAGLSIQDTVFDPGYWYITTQEAQWGAWVMETMGMDMRDNIFFGLDNGVPNPLINAPGFMSIGIILGAAVLALLRREFKIKVPSMETVVFALVGGLLMGIGARVAMGCNIGAYFATVSNGDPSGWLFLLGMVAGGYVGVKLFNLWISWRVSRSDDFAL